MPTTPSATARTRAPMSTPQPADGPRRLQLHARRRGPHAHPEQDGLLADLLLERSEPARQRHDQRRRRSRRRPLHLRRPRPPDHARGPGRVRGVPVRRGPRDRDPRRSAERREHPQLLSRRRPTPQPDDGLRDLLLRDRPDGQRDRARRVHGRRERHAPLPLRRVGQAPGRRHRGRSQPAPLQGALVGRGHRALRLPQPPPLR